MDFFFYKCYYLIDKYKSPYARAGLGAAKAVSTLLTSFLVGFYALGLVLFISIVAKFENHATNSLLLTQVTIPLLSGIIAAIRYDNRKSFAKVMKKCRNIPFYNSKNSKFFFFAIPIFGILLFYLPLRFLY